MVPVTNDSRDFASEYFDCTLPRRSTPESGMSTFRLESAHDVLREHGHLQFEVRLSRPQSTLTRADLAAASLFSSTRTQYAEEAEA